MSGCGGHIYTSIFASLSVFVDFMLLYQQRVMHQSQRTVCGSHSSHFALSTRDLIASAERANDKGMRLAAAADE